MDAATVKTRLARLCAATSEPVLEPEELDDLVAEAKRVDDAGRHPEDAAWVPTWDLHYAAALGWDLKAAKAAGSFDFETGGSAYRRSQVLRHCQEMARTHRRKVVADIAVGGDLAAGTGERAGGWPARGEED